MKFAYSKLNLYKMKKRKNKNEENKMQKKLPKKTYLILAIIGALFEILYFFFWVNLRSHGDTLLSFFIFFIFFSIPILILITLITYKFNSKQIKRLQEPERKFLIHISNLALIASIFTLILFLWALYEISSYTISPYDLLTILILLISSMLLISLRIVLKKYSKIGMVERKK